MKINTDIEHWARTRLEFGFGTLCVKRSDVNVFTEPFTHAILIVPRITQGQIHSDEELFALLRKLPANAEVILVGHGWSEKEMFTVELTVDEFITHWKGD